MKAIPLIINFAVIAFISIELVLVSLDSISVDWLLASSLVSGILTIVSFKLSKEALKHINANQE